MKKFLLSLALLGGATMMANAELVFQYEGMDLVNGATINYDGFVYEPVANPDGSPSGMYRVVVKPPIFLISTSNAVATVTATSNLSIGLCAGGECTNGTNVTKPEVNLTANTPLDLELDWAQPGINFGEDVDVPVVTVTVKASVGSETISMTVNMGGFTAGVESIAASNENMVNVVGKSLNYDLSAASQISVYSLSGKTVMAETVSGNGSISLASLPKGIYLYKVGGNNGKSGKFVLR